MQKEEFSKICRELSSGGSHALSRAILPAVKEHLASHNKKKLPVIWLETNDSGDNNIAFMNTAYPYLDRVFTEMLDLLYSNTFMAAQGRDALSILEQVSETYKGKFTLVVEGAIPKKDNGRYNIIARTETRCITALEAVTRLGGPAEYVVAIGTCAGFGGPTAARPNLTGSVGVRDVLDREVINVSGCPVNPDWFVGTLAHLLMYGRPDLDKLGRPTLFYGFTVHRHCQRRSYFDNKDFAKELGEIECMFLLGCMGPRTGADCPYRQWINHVSWPVKANTPCIGCTNEDFPDGSSPFFTPMAEKSKGQEGGKNASNQGGEQA
ncbi:hydrogenase small subunit [Pelotomaculum terephthalicicum JT]|uniref:hydrogenase small subunit n=1 Tax=Pelotomaculum TaxID=191373 RepID=UPI0009C8366A|nr:MULTISPECIES: hydrogenase small subunit [Pelotomaculum]MCG9966809.1 hydrogenase small subunit [Pelotomaculum terephthalicicum JT]OPX91590.1 MAG: Periplasmic (NiFeSe) hydrogenase small subunit precursor [Pelotomaculum sp. PtaB.Bin117]OPY62311.1 MAG: Periplasmic (NiFeSe) hydrogenase small subunit precursor [Pelotomaculum sp. PtaU1.Bin065]